VKYTYWGDANLDGSVDLTDEGIVNNNFGSGTDWFHGHFSYSGTGTTDLSGLSAVLNNFGDQSSGGALIAVPTPEPASLSIIAISMLVLLKRRKQM
jgi:hypothetical protein